MSNLLFSPVGTFKIHFESAVSSMRKVHTGLGIVFFMLTISIGLPACSEQFPLCDLSTYVPTSNQTPVPAATPIITEAPALVDLQNILARQDRNAFEAWADSISVHELNQEMALLSNDQKRSLCAFLLESNTTGSDRTLLLGLMNEILSEYDLGFYSHVFSYTEINLTGDGFFYCGNGTVEPARASFLSLRETDKRNTLMHECFHSFNDSNQGPEGALNEGSAIWIYKRVFGTDSPAEDFAEATFGKL